MLAKHPQIEVDLHTIDSVIRSFQKNAEFIWLLCTWSSPVMMFEGMNVLQEYINGTKLPELPTNAKYLYHDNTCYDWGTFGWALESEHVDTEKYSFFVFLNS